MTVTTSAPDRDRIVPAGAPGIGVVLGCDSLAIRRSGVGRVTLEVARELRHTAGIGALRLWVGDRFREADLLDRLDDEGEMQGAAAGAPAVRPRPIRILIGRIPGVQALRRGKRQLGVRQDLDALRRACGGRLVYHEPNMIAKPFPGTTVVQVNDLSWLHHPEMHPRERIVWIERHIGRTLRQASRFVALSEFTANGLSKEFSVPRERIDIVPCAAGEIFRPHDEAEAAPVLARYGLLDRRYVLSVSTLEPRKNFDRVVEAHAALPADTRRHFPLVIVGGPGWGTTLANEKAERARRDGSLRLLGHVPDADLVAITSRASLFVYASLYEGFGLPILEAMRARAPVVASSTTATGETAGGAARLVEPLDPRAIMEGMREVLDDPARAQALRDRGEAHAARFTWRRTVSGLRTSWDQAFRDDA